MDYQEQHNKRIAELKTEYLKLQRRANKRLHDLRVLAESDPKYKNVLAWAYAGAMHDIKARSGEKQMSFTRGVQDINNINVLQGMVNDVKRFLNKPTSTKSGILKSYESRVNTINQKYGTNFNWEDVANFYESAIWKKLADLFGSKTAMKIIAEVQKNAKAIIEEINAARQSHKKITLESLADIDGIDPRKQILRRGRASMVNDILSIALASVE